MRLAAVVVPLVLLAMPAAASARTVTSVYCAQGVLAVKPKLCAFYEVAGVRGTLVTKMRWRTWGGPVAVGAGIFEGNMGSRVKVTVRFGRPRLCQPGEPRQRVYTSATFRFLGESKATRAQLPGCDGAPPPPPA